MQTDLRNVTLAILAGGPGRRMGMPKAWLKFNNTSILRHIHDTLRWPGPTRIVTVESRRNAPDCNLFDAEIIDPLEQGPLRSILTALEHMQTQCLIAIPVDMPELRTQHLQWMVDSLLNRANLFGLMLKKSRIQPLPFCCRPEARPAILRQLETPDHSLHALAARENFAVLDAPPEWPDSVWRNLNRPEDLNSG